MEKAAIAVLPYGGTLGKNLAARPVSELIWPLGCPARLEGKTIADMAPNDHLIVFAKRLMHFQSHHHCPAHLSLMVMEPKIMSAAHHHLLRLSAKRFCRVFTYDPDLLAKLPNGLMLPFGTTWVEGGLEFPLEKTADLSLIASAQNSHPGHKLRHRIVTHLQGNYPEARIMGRGYSPFDNKVEGLAPFRYSVVIENTQEPNYFSEKLIDAILCETVPIYWGCPNITDFFPCDGSSNAGLILCRSQAEIEAALRHVSPEDYARRLPALQDLKDSAENYGNLFLRAAVALRDSL